MLRLVKEEFESSGVLSQAVGEQVAMFTAYVSEVGLTARAFSSEGERLSHDDFKGRVV